MTLRDHVFLSLTALLVSGCSAGGGSNDPVSDSVEPGEVTLVGTLDDGSGEVALDVLESGSLWFCGDDCFSVKINFDHADTRLLTEWAFNPGDPPAEGESPIVYVNVLWTDQSQFGRQGEHPNVDGDWGSAPGGDIVIESTCEDCVDGEAGASGYFEGTSEVTLYDGETEDANGGTLTVDAIVFRDLPLVY